jgi:hypothetical protein
MLNIGTKRELLERLIVSELVAKRGEGALARKHFTRVPRMLAKAPPDNEVSVGSDGAVLVGASVVVSPAEPEVSEREPDEHD